MLSSLSHISHRIQSRLIVLYFVSIISIVRPVVANLYNTIIVASTGSTLWERTEKKIARAALSHPLGLTLLFDYELQELYLQAKE
jgi:hypothetical protein